MVGHLSDQIAQALAECRALSVGVVEEPLAMWIEKRVGGGFAVQIAEDAYYVYRPSGWTSKIMTRKEIKDFGWNVDRAPVWYMRRPDLTYDYSLEERFSLIMER